MTPKTRFLGGMAAAALLPLILSAPAEAHPLDGTLPYGQTNCAASKRLIPNGRVWTRGGTISIYWSTTCSTNWVEWSGPSYTVTKEIHTNTAWPFAEIDYGPWSYSKQVYAPGTTAVGGQVQIQWGSTAYTYTQWSFACSSSCSWHLDTAS